MPRKPVEVPPGPWESGKGEGGTIMRNKAGDVWLAPPHPRPRAWSRLGEEGQFYVSRVQQLAMQMGLLEDELEQQIGNMRVVGISWDLIGWCVGMTGEGARKRYGGVS